MGVVRRGGGRVEEVVDHISFKPKGAKSHRATFKQQEPEDKFISCCWNSSNRLGWLWLRITAVAKSPLSCVRTSNDVQNIFLPRLKASVRVRFSRRLSSSLPTARICTRSLWNSHCWGLKAGLSEAHRQKVTDSVQSFPPSMGVVVAPE